MFGIKPKDNNTKNASLAVPGAPLQKPESVQPKKSGIFSRLFGKKAGPQTPPQPVIDPETGVIHHVAVDKKFKRMRFMERYSYRGTRVLFVIIGIFFFTIAFYVGFLIVRALLPAPDSDHDGTPDTADKCPGFSDKIDQDKDGVPDNCDDAVTPGDFSDITFSEPTLVTSDDKVFDVVFKITDANKTWGVTNLRYKVKLLSESGEVLKSQTSVSYVNPGSDTNIIEPNISTSQKARSAKVTLISGDFAKNISSQNITLTIRNKTFTPRTSDGTALFSGVIQNGSNFDLNVVNVTMIVKNASGQIVADNLTKINTLRASENRYFELRYPESLDPSVIYDVFVTTDGMDQGNFLPKHGNGSQF